MLKKLPNTFIIVFCITLIAAMLTWILPGGEYITDDSSNKTPIFEWVDNQIQSWQVFTAFYNGFVKQAGIVVFILIVGGAFWIVNKSRTVDYGIMRFIQIIASQHKYLYLKIFSSDTFIL